MSDDKPIIIIKKGGGHGGHHGGAWKVAYADFVTAMMAFFMVMWLLNTADVQTRENIASFFKKPGVFEYGSGSPLEVGNAGILHEGFVPPHPADVSKSRGNAPDVGDENTGSETVDDLSGQITPRGGEGMGIMEGDKRTHGFNTEDDGIRTPKGKGEDVGAGEMKDKMEQLKEQLESEMNSSAAMEDILGLVDIKLEADGLKIEIMDTSRTSMFKAGSARMEPAAREAFMKLGIVLADIPNKIDISGHTDAIPLGTTDAGYSNWELSSDRANAARRLLELAGVKPERIASVVGKASREPKNLNNPFAATNRRITMKLRFDVPETEQEISPEGEAEQPAPSPLVREASGPEPEGESESTYQGKISKDKIFGDSPAFGPRNPDTGF